MLNYFLNVASRMEMLQFCLGVDVDHVCFSVYVIHVSLFLYRVTVKIYLVMTTTLYKSMYSISESAPKNLLLIGWIGLFADSKRLG